LDVREWLPSPSEVVAVVEVVVALSEAAPVVFLYILGIL
jgi:hypothetical protein